MNTHLDFLKKTISGDHFTSDQMYKLCKLFITAPQAQQAAILSLLSSRKETADELTGALKFFLEQSTKFNYPNDNLIDMVGTGGDGLKTFNISTAASLVVASCEVTVTKHGGRSTTSLSGSADVLESLGIPLYDNVNQINLSLKQNNYAILWCPLFNPIFKSLGTLRKELGIPTMLNILGPIANPMRPTRQVIGVYRKDLVYKVAQVLKHSGSTHSIVVHSHDGLDELSISAPTHIAELKNGTISEYEITPEDLGLKRSNLSEVIGGSPSDNAKIIIDIFSSRQTGAPLDIVLLNAAAGLVVADRVPNLHEGITLAKQAIQSGKTLQLLHNLNSVHNISQ